MADLSDREKKKKKHLKPTHQWPFLAESVPILYHMPLHVYYCPTNYESYFNILGNDK